MWEPGRGIQVWLGLGLGLHAVAMAKRASTSITGATVPVEKIARLAGHASSRTTEVIYRNPRELHQTGEVCPV